MNEYTETLSPKVDDFSDMERVWSLNKMAEDGARLNSRDFQDGIDYATLDRMNTEIFIDRAYKEGNLKNVILGMTHLRYPKLKLGVQ